MHGYSFYLHNLLLPITPDSFTIKYKNHNKTIDLLNGEEINITTLPRLAEISFKCIIPRRKYPFAVYEKGAFLPLEWFTGIINSLYNRQSPFLFVIKKIPQYFAQDLYMQVTLESYEVLDEATNGDDVVVSINLKQYRDFKAKTLEISDNKGVVTEERPIYKEPEDSYAVKEGDTLWGISRKLVFSEEYGREVYEINRGVIEEAAAAAGQESSRNGAFLYPGIKLKMP